MTLVPVILSGGAGTRLWPVSREAMPKPFLALPDGETLLHKTAVRATRLPDVAEIVTITNREYYFATKDAYAALTDVPRLAYLLEPFGRNTGPAVAVAALYVAEAHGTEAEMLVLAADHLIHDVDAFARAVEAARAVARTGDLATFGISPTRPETGYGYIECGEPIGSSGAKKVARFVEKPTAAIAADYLAAGNYLWNSGMFCFTAGAILEALAECAPDLLAAARGAWAATRAKQALSAAMIELDAAAFATLSDISIDYAVMEKAHNVAVVPGRFDWSDVGSWQAISELVMADEDGNRSHGAATSNRISIATRDTYVHGTDRVVATIGVENLVVVETPDAVLVAHKDHLQRVKDVVSELKARGHEAYKLHRTVSRPWGTYTVLEDGPRFKIKRIEVKPGASLSLQMHHRRSEHWVVVRGTATVTNGEASYKVRPNESTYIPAHTRHRLANEQDEPLAIIEVQCGDYLGEDDIVRFDDVYGRAPARS